ncbi:MAG TPA: response regulator [Candidatus Saccharimonadales bacterium]|nr:response regulator [Candidatus Saccharimonadales bacterium]
MKKRVLFVDDDPLLLNLYALMLGDQSDAWEVALASGGRRALETLDQQHFDVVVSDMNMPGMNGVELMTEICRRHPQVSRIIISGIGDQEEIARCLKTTHQFLAKPIKQSELRATLTCIRQLDAYLRDEKLKAVVGSLDGLPSFPSVYLRVLKAVRADEPSVEAIANIVVQDPALTAKILQVANSAAFGRVQKVSSPFEAVQFLGLAAIRSIVLSSHIFADLEQVPNCGFSVSALWEDALRCAQITRHIMQIEGADENPTEDACAAAMLRNAGRLLLARNSPKLCQRASALAAQQNLAFAAAELEVFGATANGVAAYLFGLWGLSAPMVEAVAFYLQPGKSGSVAFGPLTAVHVANVLSGQLSPNAPPGEPAEFDLVYLSTIGMESRLPIWRAEIEKGLEVSA